MNVKWESLYNMWQSDNTNLPLTVELVDTLLKAGAWEQFDQVYAQMQTSVQGSPEIRAKYIEYLFHQNRLEEAAQKAQALCEATQNHPIALHYLALSLYLNGDLAGVLAMQNHSELTPETQILIARALYHTGELDKALALVAPMNLAEAQGLSAMLYLDTNQFERCLASADNALSQVDTQIDALLAKASYLVTMQQAEQAKPYIAKALQLQPHSGRALSVKGQIAFFETDMDNAIETFKLAVQYMPDHIGTWHLLAWSYFICNQLDLAKQAFEQAMALDHNFADSHGGLAVVAAASGDLENAAVLAKKALRLNSASYAGLYASSLIAERSGKQQEAQQIVEGILARSSHLEGKTNMELVSAVIDKRMNQKKH